MQFFSSAPLNQLGKMYDSLQSSQERIKLYQQAREEAIAKVETLSNQEDLQRYITEYRINPS